MLNRGPFPSHAAVSYDQKPVLEYLLSKGGDVNIEDSDKDTPLFVAETVAMAQFLLDHGADPYHCNSEGVSAARNALEEGWKDVAELLASITKEELPSLDDRIEETMANETIDATTSESELEGYVQAMMQRIQDEGGVQDEEELREVVTKIILEQLRRSVEQ